MEKKLKKNLVKGKSYLLESKDAESKGITLVALVVTIVVLLILAGVSIGTLFGNNGIITKAQEAVDRTQEGVDEEQREFENLLEQLNNIGNWTGGDTGNNTEGGNTEGGNTEGGNTEGGGDTPEEPETITSYVGYYADMENDGTVDGIIYVDLAKGKTVPGKWGNDYGAYNITPVTEGLKDYKISTKTYEGQTTSGIYKANDVFGTKQVISPVEGSTGKERFYIMALEDEKDTSNNTKFYWYKSAYGNMEKPNVTTSESFGKGKNNTIAMKEKWNLGANGGYGAGNSEDMWGVISGKIGTSSKWFVPSKEEWAAFGHELGITASDYGNLEMSQAYWSSSQGNTSYAWIARMDQAEMFFNNVDYKFSSVRLSATF